MIDSKERFSNRVNNYVKYRPTYPQQCINYLFSSIGMNKDSIVADIGSGTGIFSKLIVDRVKKVYGVEPNNEMRMASQQYLRENNNFEDVNASSENTTLDDISIDFITCAQSFHWFDMAKVKLEFRRILKPSGRVILVWNTRLGDVDKFSRGYELLIEKYSTDYEKVNHKNLKNKDFMEFFKDEKYTKMEFQNYQKVDFSGLKGRTLSSSYMPMKNEKNYKLLILDLHELFDNNKIDETVNIKYSTEIYVGQV